MCKVFLCVCTDELRTVGAGLLLIGGVVVVVSVVGCVGAGRENRFLLLMVSLEPLGPVTGRRMLSPVHDFLILFICT